MCLVRAASSTISVVICWPGKAKSENLFRDAGTGRVSRMGEPSRGGLAGRGRGEGTMGRRETGPVKWTLTRTNPHARPLPLWRLSVQQQQPAPPFGRLVGPCGQLPARTARYSGWNFLTRQSASHSVRAHSRIAQCYTPITRHLCSKVRQNLQHRTNSAYELILNGRVLPVGHPNSPRHPPGAHGALRARCRHRAMRGPLPRRRGRNSRRAIGCSLARGLRRHYRRRSRRGFDGYNCGI